MAMDTNMGVLIVDNSSTMRRIVRSSLRQLGFNNMFEAGDGSAALTKLKSEDIDFVIAAADMPQMGGLDLTKTMRADEAMKDTPVLLMMKNASRAAVTDAIAAGVNSYIVPPFTPSGLNDKIEEIFR